MVGVGRTVFAGTQLEEFKVHILGVLRNVIAPNRDLILARLEGGPLAKTGVIAGMSGSPVYVDGRLIGAVSYALGQFATEPIAGITPIAEMTDATTMGAPAPAARPVALSLPFKPAELFAVWSQRPRHVATRVALPGNAISGLAVSAGATLRPIAVPLMASGFEAGVLDPLAGAFSASGFLPVTGQSPTPPRSPPPSRARWRLVTPSAWRCCPATSNWAPPAPSRTSMATACSRSAIPSTTSGPTEFPMTTADVLVVLPSLMQSSKLASLGPVVGTLQQDRATAIAGRLGPGPQLIPMTVSLNSDRLGSRTFNFGVVRDTTFTPLLAYLAVANVLTAYERATGPGLVHHPRHRQHPRPRRAGVRGRLHRRSAGRHGGGLHRRPADAVVQEHVRAGGRGADRPHHRGLRGGADRRASSACGWTPPVRARARPRWCRWRFVGRRAKRF